MYGSLAILGSNVSSLRGRSGFSSSRNMLAPLTSGHYSRDENSITKRRTSLQKRVDEDNIDSDNSFSEITGYSASNTARNPIYKSLDRPAGNSAGDLVGDPFDDIAGDAVSESVDEFVEKSSGESVYECPQIPCAPEKDIESTDNTAKVYEIDAEDGSFERRRRDCASRFAQTMQRLYAKYSADLSLESDEVNILTGEIIVDHGHLRKLRNRNTKPHEERQDRAMSRKSQQWWMLDRANDEAVSAARDDIWTSPKRRKKSHREHYEFIDVWNFSDSESSSDTAEDAEPEQGDLAMTASYHVPTNSNHQASRTANHQAHQTSDALEMYTDQWQMAWPTALPMAQSLLSQQFCKAGVENTASINPMFTMLASSFQDAFQQSMSNFFLYFLKGFSERQKALFLRSDTENSMPLISSSQIQKELQKTLEISANAPIVPPVLNAPNAPNAPIAMSVQSAMSITPALFSTPNNARKQNIDSVLGLYSDCKSEPIKSAVNAKKIDSEYGFEYSSPKNGSTVSIRSRELEKQQRQQRQKQEQQQQLEKQLTPMKRTHSIYESASVKKKYAPLMSLID